MIYDGNKICEFLQKRELIEKRFPELVLVELVKLTWSANTLIKKKVVKMVTL